MFIAAKIGFFRMKKSTQMQGNGFLCGYRLHRSVFENKVNYFTERILQNQINTNNINEIRITIPPLLNNSPNFAKY